MTITLARRILLAVAVLALAGCAHYPPNDRLAQRDPAQGYRFTGLSGPDNTDSLLVILTFSGGGTRAAALAYGVLEQLATTEIVWEGRRKRLLDEVDIISAVSGGSFTAAYYALYRERIFSDFEDRFLKRDVQGELARKMLNPVNLARAASPKFGRIDLVAEYLDEALFDRGTYGTLLERDERPFVIINASDMSLGTRFEFTQDQFDLICSDLAAFPLARAVAASSAVPVVFSPVTLRNYGGSCRNDSAAMEKAAFGAAPSARRMFKAAETSSYLDAAARPYIHLLDGGITDNIGLRGLLDRLAVEGGPAGMARALELDGLRKAVIIVVNAETAPDYALDRQEDVPTVNQVMRAIRDIPINRYSFETTELLRANFEHMADRMRTRRGEVRAGAADAGFDYHLIEVTFDAIADPQERDFFRAIPTSYSLPASTVDRLRQRARNALEASADYRRLLRDTDSR